MDRIQFRIMAVTLGSAVLISPHHLRLWGNLAGQTGYFSLVVVVVVVAAVLVIWPSVKHYHFLISQHTTGRQEAGWRHGGVPIGP